MLNRINEFREAVSRAKNSDEVVTIANDFAANVQIAIGLDLAVSFDEAALVAFSEGHREIGNAYLHACDAWASHEWRQERADAKQTGFTSTDNLARCHCCKDDFIVSLEAINYQRGFGLSETEAVRSIDICEDCAGI